MPSPGEDVQAWSKTAADNAGADPLINWAEGMPRADVNNSARSVLAAVAKWRDLQNGTIVTTGTPNAQLFLSDVGYTATVPTGLIVGLKIGPGLTNTDSATLGMDSIPPAVIKDQLGADLKRGELLENSYASFIFDGTNWILLANFRAGLAVTNGPTNIRVFNASGTYPTVTNPDIKVMAYCKGGGGSGGSSNDTRSGGGGGEGAEGWKLTTAGALSGQAVTVGDGAPPSVPAGTGGFGSPSSVGSIITANGGGWANVGHNGGTGGAGGLIGTCDWGMPGAHGHTGGDFTIGTVGIASVGGGKGGGAPGAAAVANSGGGGGGSNAFNISGAGGSGIVVCTEYGSIT